MLCGSNGYAGLRGVAMDEKRHSDMMSVVTEVASRVWMVMASLFERLNTVKQPKIKKMIN